MTKAICPKCGAEVIEAYLVPSLHGLKLVLDAKPDPKGQVLIQSDMTGTKGTYLSGDALRNARDLKLPIHSRHGIRCPSFWGRNHPNNRDRGKGTI